MKFSLSSWNTVGGPGFSGVAVYSTSIATDSTGTPYIAYRDTASAATVMKYDSGSMNWVNFGNATSILGNNVQQISLACSRAASTKDSLYVGFVRQVSFSPPTYSVSVIKFNGTSWEFVGGQDFYIETNMYGLSFLQLAIAPNDGTLYVSIQGGGFSGVTRVMSFQ